MRTLAPYRPTVVRARADRTSALPGWRSLLVSPTTTKAADPGALRPFGYLRSVLAQGNACATAIANRTLAEVSAAMGISY